MASKKLGFKHKKCLNAKKEQCLMTKKKRRRSAKKERKRLHREQLARDNPGMSQKQIKDVANIAGTPLFRKIFQELSIANPELPESAILVQAIPKYHTDLRLKREGKRSRKIMKKTMDGLVLSLADVSMDTEKASSSDAASGRERDEMEEACLSLDIDTPIQNTH